MRRPSRRMLKTTRFIETTSFRLAIYQKGSVEADKLALLLPGRLDTKDYPHMRSHVDFLAAKGYLALSFDPPGTWESDGGISIYSMTNYLKAIKEIIEYYGNRPTFVMGHSRGGSMSILAGTRLKHVERFAAAMSPATYKTKNFVDKGWKEKGYAVSVRDTPKGYAERTKTFELPYAFFEDSSQYDVRSDLKKCTKPKLFIAGSKDTVVNPNSVKEAYELSAEPKHFEMLDSDHDYRQNAVLIKKVNEIVGGFIENEK